MKREILFRGKRIDNNEWVYGNLLQSEKNTHGETICHIVTRFAFDNNCRQYEVDPETVGQYIGLKDKSGKRIFEGDFIKCSGGLRLEFYPDSGVVVYNVDSFSMRAKTESGDPWHFSINFSDGTEIEILGHIHENSELLK